MFWRFFCAFLGGVFVCFLTFGTSYAQLTNGTTVINNSSYLSHFDFHKNKGLLDVVKTDPWSTALVGGLVAEGSLDILASDTMSLQHFHGPTGTWNTYETNPLLGKYPSFLQYDFVAPALVGVALGIGLHLPEPIRIPILLGVVGYEGWNVATMIATFSLSTFAFPEFIAGLVVGAVITWAVYHAVSWVLDTLFPKYEDPGVFLLKTYEKIQGLSLSPEGGK